MKKQSPLERVLQHHSRMCTRFVYHDPDRLNKCSCGRDEAAARVANLLQIEILVRYLIQRGAFA
jgi:hypothetical protein